MNATTRWVGPISGLVAVILVVLGEGISGTIDSEPSDTPTAVLAEFRDSADDVRLGAIFGVIAAGLLLVYIGHLRTRLRDLDARWAGNVFAAGGVALVAAVLVFVGAELTGAEAGEQGHAEVAQAVVDFNWNGVWIFSPGLLAVGIAVSLASLSYRVLPGWLGVLGVLVALSAIVPWIGVPIFGIWVLAATIEEIIAISRGRSNADSPPEPGMSTA